MSEQDGGVVVGEVRTASIMIAWKEIARGSHQQGKGQIGRGRIQDPGRVADGNAQLSRSFEIDVVTADSEIADHF